MDCKTSSPNPKSEFQYPKSKMKNLHYPFRFSRTGLKGLKPSPTLTMNDRIQEMRASGREVYHLGFGEARFPVHPKIAQALRENVQQRSYLPALGLPALRQEIAGFYTRHFDLPVTADQIVIGPGSKSLLYAMMAALDGDIIMPTPAWSSYKDLATLTERPILEVPTEADANYQINFDQVQSAITAVSKEWRHPDLLLVNTPHNPTGTVLPAANVQEMANFARARDLMIVSDEIYSMVTYNGTVHTSPAHFYPEGTVILGGLSKHMSLGGWRFGVAILPSGAAGAALARAVQAIAGCIWSCVTAPVQHAALVAYSNDADVDSYIRACTQMHAARTCFLYDAFIEFGLLCPEPKSAFYLYPSFAQFREPLAARGVRTCQDLSLYLLDNYEISTLPGAIFGDDPQALALRFSTSFLDAETDEQAHNLVTAFNTNSDPDHFVQNHHPRLREVAARLAAFVTELEKNNE
ncbi:MAG: aminotransferase class I/II-fold pyridoxal phosphate-dependent enzyme [Chloroflexi bacterium]|nr:MAG: aminotransferase class I/II-fold pyridoxal phosphate-dependent enzyme [Chloroflexota bacterium]